MRERNRVKKIVSSSALPLHEVTIELHNLFRSGVEREMATSRTWTSAFGTSFWCLT